MRVRVNFTNILYTSERSSLLVLYLLSYWLWSWHFPRFAHAALLVGVEISGLPKRRGVGELLANLSYSSLSWSNLSLLQRLPPWSLLIYLSRSNLSRRLGTVFELGFATTNSRPDCTAVHDYVDILGWGSVLIVAQCEGIPNGREFVIENVAYIPSFQTSVISYDILERKGWDWKIKDQWVELDRERFCQTPKHFNMWTLEYNPAKSSEPLPPTIPTTPSNLSPSNLEPLTIPSSNLQSRNQESDTSGDEPEDVTNITPERDSNEPEYSSKRIGRDVTEAKTIQSSRPWRWTNFALKMLGIDDESFYCSTFVGATLLQTQNRRRLYRNNLLLKHSWRDTVPD